MADAAAAVADAAKADYLGARLPCTWPLRWRVRLLPSYPGADSCRPVVHGWLVQLKMLPTR